MRRYMPFLLVVVTLVSLLTGPLSAAAQEDDMCTPDAVRRSFAEAEDVAAWSQGYLGSDCSLRIKSGVAALVAAYNALQPVELGPFPYEGLEQSVTEDGLPQLGVADAPLTINMYESFGCGHCANFSQNQFLDILPNVAAGEVRLVFITITNDFSVAASAGASCALEQDMFWEMHDILFGYLQNYGNNAFDVQRILLGAEDLGLDMTAFRACLSNPATFEQLEALNAQFFALSNEYESVTGTPTLTFNGVPPEWGSGAPDIEYILQQIAATATS